MDDIVAQSLKKWPDVPHCYHWLALDRRGHWRMRDETAQRHNLPGDIIRHDALSEFISRNYLYEQIVVGNQPPQLAWYFQNGPQRVYVDLEVTPFIARIYPDCQIRLSTGQPISASAISQLMLSATGDLVIVATLPDLAVPVVALIDDRDLHLVTSHLVATSNGENSPPTDTLLDAALAGDTAALRWHWHGRLIPLVWYQPEQLPALFGHLLKPSPPASKDNT